MPSYFMLGNLVNLPSQTDIFSMFMGIIVNGRLNICFAKCGFTHVHRHIKIKKNDYVYILSVCKSSLPQTQSRPHLIYFRNKKKYSWI